MAVSKELVQKGQLLCLTAPNQRFFLRGQLAEQFLIEVCVTD